MPMPMPKASASASASANPWWFGTRPVESLLVWLLLLAKLLETRNYFLSLSFLLGQQNVFASTHGEQKFVGGLRFVLGRYVPLKCEQDELHGT